MLTPNLNADITSNEISVITRSLLKFACFPTFFLLVTVSPLLQVAFLGMFLYPGQPTVTKFALAIGTVRALRQVRRHLANPVKRAIMVLAKLIFSKI